MDLQLSIVVPVYNAASFLPQCFACLEAQGLAQGSYEILFVDDCSTDDSPQLLEEFGNGHPEARIIHRDKNGGAGAARNTGIKEAKGKLLYFLDADDKLDEGALPKLVQYALENDLDLLFFSGRIAYESEAVKKTNPQSSEYFVRRQPNEITTGRDLFIQQQADNNFCAVPYLQLTRRSLVAENDITFPEGIVNEDNAFVLLTTLAAKRVATDPGTYYTYLVRAGSATTASGEWKRYDAHAYLADLADKLIYQAQDANDLPLAEALADLRGYWILMIEQAVAQLSRDDYKQLTYHTPSILLDERMLYRPFSDVIALLEQEKKEHDTERQQLKQQIAQQTAEKERAEQSLRNTQESVAHMQNLLDQERAEKEKALARIRELEESTTWKVGRAATALPRALKSEYLKKKGQ